MYNMMSCTGWGKSGISFLGPCSQAWIGLVIIAFLIMVARRQSEDGFLSGTGFNIFGAIGFGVGANLLVTAFIGAARWSMLAGVLGVVAGGFGVGFFLGGSDGQ